MLTISSNKNKASLFALRTNFILVYAVGCQYHFHYFNTLVLAVLYRVFTQYKFNVNYFRNGVRCIEGSSTDGDRHQTNDLVTTG